MILQHCFEWPHHIHNAAVKVIQKWYKSNINTYSCKWVLFHHSFPTAPRHLLFCLFLSLGLRGLFSSLMFCPSIRSSTGPVGRSGWVWIPPPWPMMFLAQLSSKAFSSRTVFTGWVSTGSRQYFARLWANRGSCDCFAHGHRQSGVHRIDWGNFPIGQMEESHPLPSSSFPPVWHRPCPEWQSWCGLAVLWSSFRHQWSTQDYRVSH